MKTLKNLVIGSSLSEHSDGVVRTGLAIAKATGATAWLLHTASLFEDPSGTGATASGAGASWNRLREQLEEQARRTWLSALPGFTPNQVRLTVGAPHRMIVELAESVQADLVVVGASESSLHLGSTADRVIRKATCPVLAVRNESAFPPHIVEFPVDLSPVSASALRQGLAFLAQLGLQGVESEALFILNPFEVGGSIHFTPEQIESFASAELKRFVAASAPGRECPRSTRVCIGYEREAILATIRDRQVDLAVLGTHGRGGFERFMLGSVAAAMLKSAQCNLLIVPPESEADTQRVDADWTYISDETSVVHTVRL